MFLIGKEYLKITEEEWYDQKRGKSEQSKEIRLVLKNYIELKFFLFNNDQRYLYLLGYADNEYYLVIWNTA